MDPRHLDAHASRMRESFVSRVRSAVAAPRRSVRSRAGSPHSRAVHGLSGGPANSRSDGPGHSRSGGARRPRRVATAVLLATAICLVGLGPAPAGASSTSGSSGRSSGSSGTGSYVVRPGDTIGAISRRTGVPADALRAANGIVGDRLYAGARLALDPSAATGRSTSAGSSASGTYVVRRNDALSLIAKRHGVRLADLLAANGLSSRSVIHPGKRLTIPGGGSGGGSGVSKSAASVGPRIVCPVLGASFMNDWGFPRGSTRFHEGTDLFAPRGTAVGAPITGQMTFGSNGLGGRTFTIVSPSGWVAYGAHLDSTVGQSRWVAAGDLVGTVGDSGNAKGGPTHLHLSLRMGNGRPVNPYPSVSAAC